MPIDPDELATIAACITVNETGRLPSPEARGTATVLTDGAGISYGPKQVTDRADSLDAVVRRYADYGGRLGDRLEAYLPRLDADATAGLDPRNLPAWALDLLDALHEAGSDPVMARAQDEVFAEQYLSPALARAEAMGLRLPLSRLALCDTAVHSGPSRIDSLRRAFPERPPVRGGEERVWTSAFLRARRAWLAGFVGRDDAHTALVRRTVYRVDWILGLVARDAWDLRRPFAYGKLTIPADRA